MLLRRRCLGADFVLVFKIIHLNLLLWRRPLNIVDVHKGIIIHTMVWRSVNLLKMWRIEWSRKKFFFFFFSFAAVRRLSRVRLVGDSGNPCQKTKKERIYGLAALDFTMSLARSLALFTLLCWRLSLNYFPAQWQQSWLHLGPVHDVAGRN